MYAVQLSPPKTNDSAILETLQRYILWTLASQVISKKNYVLNRLPIQIASEKKLKTGSFMTYMIAHIFFPWWAIAHA